MKQSLRSVGPWKVSVGKIRQDERRWTSGLTRYGNSLCLQAFILNTLYIPTTETNWGGGGHLVWISVCYHPEVHPRPLAEESGRAAEKVNCLNVKL